jgi:hypothetical protein
LVFVGVNNLLGYRGRLVETSIGRRSRNSWFLTQSIVKPGQGFADMFFKRVATVKLVRKQIHLARGKSLRLRGADQAEAFLGAPRAVGRFAG